MWLYYIIVVNKSLNKICYLSRCNLIDYELRLMKQMSLVQIFFPLPLCGYVKYIYVIDFYCGLLIDFYCACFYRPTNIIGLHYVYENSNSLYSIVYLAI
jgi:hypothetical protein